MLIILLHQHALVQFNTNVPSGFSIVYYKNIAMCSRLKKSLHFFLHTKIYFEVYRLFLYNFKDNILSFFSNTTLWLVFNLKIRNLNVHQFIGFYYVFKMFKMSRFTRINNIIGVIFSPIPTN